VSAMVVEEGLFGVGWVAWGPAGVRPAVAKMFRVYDQGQSFLLPPSLRDWLPEDHLALFVSELVEEVLDLGPFLAAYTEVRGFPPYDPRLMLKVLLYGYTTGVRSSRVIERRCHDDVAFRFLSANAGPDFRSVARFRRGHLKALEGLFVQVLSLCRAAGMARLGRVALDGTKVKANASRHKSMSYDRMAAAEAELAGEVAGLLRDAERTDAAEDAEHGRGGGLEGELARREPRLGKIGKAKGRSGSRGRSGGRGRRRGEGAAGRGHAGRGRAGRGRDRGGPGPGAAQLHRPGRPDHEDRDGSFHYCYNAQAVALSDQEPKRCGTLTEVGEEVPDLLDWLVHGPFGCGVTPRTWGSSTSITKNT